MQSFPDVIPLNIEREFTYVIDGQQRRGVIRLVEIRKLGPAKFGCYFSITNFHDPVAKIYGHDPLESLDRCIRFLDRLVNGLIEDGHQLWWQESGDRCGFWSEAREKVASSATKAPSIRTSAKAIIIRDGHILLTRNRDQDGDWYLCPGGGQHHGESLEQAVIREVFEETGCRVRVGPLLCVRDYIAAHHEFAASSPDQHQVEFYFLCELLEAPADLNAGHERDSMQVGVEWIALETLATLRVYPKSLAANCFQPESTYLGDVN